MAIFMIMFGVFVTKIETMCVYLGICYLGLLTRNYWRYWEYLPFYGSLCWETQPQPISEQWNPHSLTGHLSHYFLLCRPSVADIQWWKKWCFGAVQCCLNRGITMEQLPENLNYSGKNAECLKTVIILRWLARDYHHDNWFLLFFGVVT